MPKQESPQAPEKVAKLAVTKAVTTKSRDTWQLIGIAVATLVVLGAVFFLGHYVGQHDSDQTYLPRERFDRPMMDRGYWR